MDAFMSVYLRGGWRRAPIFYRGLGEQRRSEGAYQLAAAAVL
jgi:hypothetical protein